MYYALKIDHPSMITIVTITITINQTKAINQFKNQVNRCGFLPLKSECDKEAGNKSFLVIIPTT